MTKAMLRHLLSRRFLSSTSAAYASGCGPKQRLKGRRSSTTTATPMNSAFFDHSFSKVFTRRFMERFGSTAVDDAMLVLNPGGKMKARRLDEKKRKQLATLYFETISTIVCEVPGAADVGVVITKVDVSQHFTELKVFWKAYGNEKDIVVKSTLENAANDIRRKLSTSLYHSNVPPVVFIPDRFELVVEEMNKLFEAADYGMQYRAVSHTGAVLGSKNDDGSQAPQRAEKVPRFVLAKREKMARRDAARKETAEEDRASEVQGSVDSDGNSFIK